MQFQIASRTDIGSVRSINQDALLVRPDLGLFCVADGMGGEKAGEEASAQVIATLERELAPWLHRDGNTPTAVQLALCTALIQANGDVLTIGRREPEKQGLGSTATVLCLRRGLGLLAHVGDSRLYLSRGRRTRQLTRDHTFVWQLYEAGAISRTQLELHPERHLLTQCIGDPRSVQVETLQEKIEPGDILMLCSDGLTGYASEEQLFQVMLNEELDAAAKAEQMVALALAGGGGDNVSIVLIEVGELDTNDNWEPEATSATITQDSHQAVTRTAASEDTPFLDSTWNAEQEKVRRAGRRAIVATALLVLLLMVMVVLALHMKIG